MKATRNVTVTQLYPGLSVAGFWEDSDKLDVEDHYIAWRQSHDSPPMPYNAEGPFSFCSYPFLLNPRAKSKLLHTEVRLTMTQVRTLLSTSYLNPILSSKIREQTCCAGLENFQRVVHESKIRRFGWVKLISLQLQ